MSAKEALIWNVNRGMSVSEAAEIHGVGRSCAYKWVRRYEEQGAAGLVELSRVPEYSPNRTLQAIENELVQLKESTRTSDQPSLWRCSTRVTENMCWP